jgi:hypothetical protein
MELYGANGGGRTTGSLVEGWAGAAMDDVSIVPVSTMDILLESRFPGQQCLVLADVEGAEKTMLDGAEKFLKREPKPIWMVEISSKIVGKSGDHIINPHLISTFQIFWNHGYEAWTADEKVRLVTAAEVEAVVKTGQDLSTHNFLFMPRGKRQEIFGAVSGI